MPISERVTHYVLAIAQLLSIQSRKWLILAYTPGTSDAHPPSQVTIPTTVHLPVVDWQTSGDPLSLVQATFPFSPPAQISDGLSENLSPVPGLRLLRASLRAVLHR